MKRQKVINYFSFSSHNNVDKAELCIFFYPHYCPFLFFLSLQEKEVENKKGNDKNA